MTSKHRKKLNESVALAAITALSKNHPALFSMESPVPLKIGIDRDFQIVHPEASRTFVRRLLRWYTRSSPYLETLTEGALRHGFIGPDGAVTAEQAATAAKLLSYRAKKTPIQQAA
jgi:sRNA-binding protein